MRAYSDVSVVLTGLFVLVSQAAWAQQAPQQAQKKAQTQQSQALPPAYWSESISGVTADLSSENQKFSGSFKDYNESLTIRSHAIGVGAEVVKRQLRKVSVPAFSEPSIVFTEGSASFRDQTADSHYHDLKWDPTNPALAEERDQVSNNESMKSLRANAGAAATIPGIGVRGNSGVVGVAGGLEYTDGSYRAVSAEKRAATGEMYTGIMGQSYQVVYRYVREFSNDGARPNRTDGRGIRVRKFMGRGDVDLGFLDTQDMQGAAHDALTADVRYRVRDRIWAHAGLASTLDKNLAAGAANQGVSAGRSNLLFVGVTAR